MKSILLVFFLIIVSVFTASISSALDYVSESKSWECTVSIGYANHIKDYVDDSVVAGFRTQKRLIYPLLLGIGVDASYFQNIILGSVSMPISYRVSIRNYKLDAVIKPGGAYAYNIKKKNKINKVMGVVSSGIELKKFITKGKSIGIGAYYSIYENSKLNDIRVTLLYGF